MPWRRSSPARHRKHEGQARAVADRRARSGRFDPADVSPAYYRHVHNRIAAGQPVRAYSRDQHTAYLASRKVSA
ncbi:DUF2840 domain-containing protein [Iodidimonas nitroreducens]|uniref:DUF2840 domain-containing protein n=1 Tax=Iodidimonas nitroreducens TaxID=1236968 RepID=UPI0036F1B491